MTTKAIGRSLPTIGQFQRLAKLLDPKTNAVAIQVGMAGSNPLNIGHIFGTMRYGFEGDQVFGGVIPSKSLVL